MPLLLFLTGGCHWSWASSAGLLPPWACGRLPEGTRIKRPAEAGLSLEVAIKFAFSPYLVGPIGRCSRIERLPSALLPTRSSVPKVHC
ncbi:hypothetical protein ABIE49_006103 [Bradyrhizobium sp. OAE829]